MPDIAEGISIGIEMRIFSVAPPGKRHSLAGRSRYSAPGNVAGKITRARYQLFKLRISVTEQNPAPCLAIGRNIPSKVAQQKIRLSATAGAPKKKAHHTMSPGSQPAAAPAGDARAHSMQCGLIRPIFPSQHLAAACHCQVMSLIPYQVSLLLVHHLVCWLVARRLPPREPLLAGLLRRRVDALMLDRAAISPRQLHLVAVSMWEQFG